MAEENITQDETDNETENSENAEAVQEEENSSKLGFLKEKKFKIVGIVLVVMLLEAVGMYFLLPAPSVANEITNASVVSGEEGSTESGDALATKEVNIDKFNTTNSIAAPGSVIHVSFTLVAIVSADNVTSFETVVSDEKKWRVQQVVIKVVRSASLEDLNDPNLGTIKRLIREEINKVLGKSYVSNVVIGGYRTMEQ